MKNLPEIIRDELAAQNLSYRAVSERAASNGHSVSYSLVGKYAKGRAVEYSRDKVVAIAAGLGVPSSRLLMAAEMPVLGDPFELRPESSLLEPHEREAVRRVVDAFIQNKTREQPDREVDRIDRENAERRNQESSEQRRAVNEPTPIFGSGRVIHGTEDDEDEHDLAASVGDDGVPRRQGDDFDPA